MNSEKKFPIYQQYDAMDCGPTCLRMIASFYGKDYPLAYLREKCYADREGTSLLCLRDAVKEMGMNAKFALISLALFGVFLVSTASTAIDRIALYMLPLQLVIFAHLPDVLSEETETDVSPMVLGVLGFYGLVQFVWLNFADHAYTWLPYRFYPLEVWF